MKKIQRHDYDGNDIISTRTITINPVEYTQENIERLMQTIRDNLTPDLLKFKRLKYKGDSKYYGHCYHSTHALFLILNTDRLVPMSGEDFRGENHWWLQDKETQTIYDCTPEQYYIKEQQPPYDKGKKSSWYGWKGRPLVCTMNLVKRVAIHENIFLDDTETFVNQNDLNKFLKSS